MKFLRSLFAFIAIVVISCNFTAALSSREELTRAVIEKNIRMICMQRKTISETVIPKIPEHTDQIFSELEGQITDDIWTMVIFSENFWGNSEEILNSEEVTSIVNSCNELTSRHPRTIIHINFLHKFDKSRISSSNCGWLNYGKTKRAKEDDIISIQRPSAFLSVSKSKLHVANYSLIVWNSNPIAIYRKSTYFDEANDLVTYSKGEYAYEFGDFQTHPLIKPDRTSIVSCFCGSKPLISTRICADMNKKTLPDVGHAILIVSANRKKVDKTFKKLIPSNVAAIVCDTTFGAFLLCADKVHTTVTLQQSFSMECCFGYCCKMNDVLDLNTVESVVSRSETFRERGDHETEKGTKKGFKGWFDRFLKS